MSLSLTNAFSVTHIWCSAWDEVHDVFGDGHDYDWALDADDEVEREDDIGKPEMKYQDVSRPKSAFCSFLTSFVGLRTLGNSCASPH